MSQGDSEAGHEPRRFATTHWSLVVAAGAKDASTSRQALATLCETYWYPLYVFVRRQGLQPAEAQDMTQAFFAELLEKDRLRLADQERGRFRTFLLSSLRNFLNNQWRKAQATRRGGGRRILSLDLSDAESRYTHESAGPETPEELFERRWALTLLDNTLAKLQDEYARSGKDALYQRLKDHLGGGAEAIPYREIAEEMGTTEAAVKVAAHRLRRRCRQLLRQEIAETVATTDQVDEELQDLFAALAR
jgi:RNA polymerase sigma-70 factor (ECF subfamily)